MEQLKKKIQRNEELLASMKQKKTNLEIQIENLEHRIQNQKRALESKE